MIDDSPAVILRPMTSDDVPFVLSSWLKSHRRCGDVSHMVDELYFRSYRAHVLRLLQTASVTIAAPEEDAGQIVGYLCSDHIHGLAHFVYVKHVFRRFGIARRLWEYAGQPMIATTLWPTSVKRDGALSPTFHGPTARRLGIRFDPYGVPDASKPRHPSRSQQDHDADRSVASAA